MKDNQPGHTGHTPEALMAAYVIGKCSPAEQSKIDEHCLSCEECRARLTTLLRVCAASEDERHRLEELFPLDTEAIAQDRQHVSALDAEMARNRVGRRAYLLLALVAVSLIALGAIYFWVQWRRSPSQDALAALRRSYRQSRPLEARVTGGFAYQPYERKRGPIKGLGTEDSNVDRDQLNYALVELTRAVASHPTPEARHNLGRLYLLTSDFERAEEQLTQALAGAPREARLHADLATLYYERSKLADPLPLLLKAAEHYDTAIELEPQLAEAWFNRALCREQMAIYSGARADWERYLQFDPGP